MIKTAIFSTLVPCALLFSIQASAQQKPETTPPNTEQDETNTQAQSDEPTTQEKSQPDKGIKFLPDIAQPNSYFTPDGQREAFERKLGAYTLIGLGIPMALFGIGQLAKAYGQTGSGYGGRSFMAKEAGAAMIGGAAMAAQGTVILREEEKRKKRLEKERKRAALITNPPPSYDPLISRLEHDAELGRENRDMIGNIVMFGGIFVGGLIGAIPFADGQIDRWTFVAIGAGVAAASIGTGTYLWLSDSHEESIYKDALKQK